eukprot:TRINITY_DN19243_c0_g1_i1.p1 TRINITY_DN19243_c0_g1~~TRINITY_DN19243_c0_g1_i1.p1  ORF type:complete len:715 (+),score=165.55 TRINITY_DN19243_c0_g1_i1:77-2221(+)
MACQSLGLVAQSTLACGPASVSAALAGSSSSAASSLVHFEGLRVTSKPLRRGGEFGCAVSELKASSSARSSQKQCSQGPECIVAPSKPASEAPTKRSKVEVIKEQSDYLRHPLLEELANENPNINEAAAQLMKFHGSYQQDDREARVPGQGKAYQFMMRTRQPAGKVSNQVYKTMDDLANKYGNGTLRLTTRQTFQMHGILKENVKTVFSTVIRNMGSTLGACGDLNRNVLSPPVPYVGRPEYEDAEALAEKIAHMLAPQAGAYYDVWLDGEKVMTVEEPEDAVVARNDNTYNTNFDLPEPIYGKHFLPRKFKIAVTVPGDNSVDLLTNDVGVVVIPNAAGEIEGYNIYVGGGMGRTHRNEETFPRLAEPLGFVPKEDILYAVKAIVVTQREYGRRDDRKLARMKYLIESWGIDKFRSVVEQFYGKRFESFRELPPWQFQSYLGWHEQGDGRLFCGVHVENGRLKGDRKKTLRDIIEKYDIPVRITANQNVILCDVKKAWRSAIQKELTDCGLVPHKKIDSLNITAMACPALPLCGLAIAEAERGLPDVLLRLRALMKKVGLSSKEDTMVVRMTGCPNGCARPYMAELGFVGDGANSYQIWLGGRPNQTRLAQVFLEKMKLHTMEETLEPIFVMWKQQRLEGEPFGDFIMRAGFEKVRTFMAAYGQKVKSPLTKSARVVLETPLYDALAKEAQRRGVKTSAVIADALSSYLPKE